MDKNSSGADEAPHPDAFGAAAEAESAIAQWRRNMQAQGLAYFDGLRSQGLAPVQRHALRGRTFIDVSIEGRRFKGQVRKGPQILVGEEECLLTTASISFGADFLTPDGPPHWALSKYRTQQRIPLDELSPEGLRSLACEFGLLIHGDDNPAAESLLASECFMLSRAWAGCATGRSPILTSRASSCAISRACCAISKCRPAGRAGARAIAASMTSSTWWGPEPRACLDLG